MVTFEEYMQLYTTKDPKLIDRAGMDKDQRESTGNPCKWTVAVLERIGDAIQIEGLRISPEQQYRLSIIMRSANNDCRKCKCPEEEEGKLILPRSQRQKFQKCL